MSVQLHGPRLPNLPNCFFLGSNFVLAWLRSTPCRGEGEERFEKNDWDVIAFGNLFELVFALEIYGEETVMLLYIFFFLFLRISRISIYGEIYGFRVVPTFCIFIRAKVIVE